MDYWFVDSVQHYDDEGEAIVDVTVYVYGSGNAGKISNYEPLQKTFIVTIGSDVHSVNIDHRFYKVVFRDMDQAVNKIVYNAMMNYWCKDLLLVTHQPVDCIRVNRIGNNILLVHYCFS